LLTFLEVFNNYKITFFSRRDFRKIIKQIRVRKSGENGMIIHPVPFMEQLIIENKLIHSIEYNISIFI